MQPRKTARQARSAATTDVIVEAAARILETSGHAGFTTNAIAERAGVSVGSLYQYFPNKDAITRALIRRELGMLETAIMAIDVNERTSAPLTRLIDVAVGQQLRRPSLAQLLEVEEDRLDASGDIDPVRSRVARMVSAILDVTHHPEERGIVQDVMALIATLVNAAVSRGERNAVQLVLRVEAVVLGRLSVVRSGNPG